MKNGARVVHFAISAGMSMRYGLFNLSSRRIISVFFQLIVETKRHRAWNKLLGLDPKATVTLPREVNETFVRVPGTPEYYQSTFSYVLCLSLAIITLALCKLITLTCDFS